MLATSIIAWYLTDYFFKGERVVLSNFKTAAGVFEQDKYLSILQGIVNLVLSIALVFKIGLAGVFIGTVVSGLIANITKPIIIYRVCFEKKCVFLFSGVHQISARHRSCAGSAHSAAESADAAGDDCKICADDRDHYGCL